MTGYSRQDTANNIANGNVINADDLDSEFNAIEGAFNGTSGHSHDGSAGGGAAISKVGPAQDLVVSTSQVLPKASNTLDLGSSATQFKDAYFDGTVTTDILQVDEELNVTGLVDVTGSILVTGGVTAANFTGNASSATKWATARTLSLSGDASGSVSLDGTANGTLAVTVVNDSHNHSSTTISDFTEATQDVVGGMVTGNTESGIAVTYDDTLGKLNFNVNDPTITLSGDVAGSATMTDLGSVTISTTIQPNSVALGGDTTGNYVAALTAGTGVTIANNIGEGVTPTISIGQPVSTTSNVTFNNLVVSGNLTVSGSTTTVNTETINLADNIITLNSNETGTPTQNAGIEVERGTEVNKSFYWEEANDRWTFGTESVVASQFIGNASTATALATSRTISLGGDVSGSASFNGTSNITITATIADDSHNHVIANVDGLQTALNNKASLNGDISETFAASSVTINEWTITYDAGYLVFSSVSTPVMKLDSAGNLTVAGNVTANGTI
jgi:hypothetical protein